MKRKLDEHDIPTPVGSTTAETTFADLNLEPRLLRGIRDQKWSSPTLVQAKAIPLALEGKDILARSSTGTGKTAAYILPILDHIIRRSVDQRETSALILAPTRELSTQVEKLTKTLCAHCGDIRVLNLAGKASEAAQKASLAGKPHIVIATPSRAVANLNDGALSLEKLAHLVIDEADVIMGYGVFEEDLKSLQAALPRSVQVFLLSATLSTELDTLNRLFCRNPAIVKIDDNIDVNLVKQYVIKCAEEEKFLLLYSFFLLKLIKGKTIIFVGDIDRSYRVKLFLEQFGIKSCVLNSELPLASRLHIVEEYNKNVYDILIASDENEVLGAAKDEGDAMPRKKAKVGSKGSKDSGVSRGIDFLNVSCVLNFDLPSNYKSYFHRIGRTARAGKSGTAISFVIPKENYRKHKPTTFAGSENDVEVLRKIEKHQKQGQKIENYDFDMKRLEPFRYRFADALRAVTRIAIREARIKELRQELLKSEKLSRYFEEHPDALSHLRHDQNLNHPARIQQHLKHVPDYLLPGKKLAEDIGFVGMEKQRPNRFKKGKSKKVFKKGKLDPLKTFNARGRGKK